MTRVLVFNFFGGVMDRGIPLYAQDIATCLRQMGFETLVLSCPRWLQSLPRPLMNLAFVLFEQVGAPVVRALRGCAFTVYPYNSAGIVDAALGRSVIVVHDLIGNGRNNARLAARYVRYTQAVHRALARPVCAASAHTLAHLRRLPAFRRCALRLWRNPFYAFEAALARRSTGVASHGAAGMRVLLCSGIGPNKDYAGALSLFTQSRVMEGAQLHVVGFGDDAHLAIRRASHLPDPVRERIVVLPRLSLDELVAEYAASDLVWVHSQKEGFGRFVIEGMMCERPVLASNISAFRDLVGPGLYLYRKGHFEEAASRALSGHLAPRANFATYHSALETAVREVVSTHFPVALTSHDPRPS